MGDFAEIVPASALRAQNLDTVLDMIFKYLPYGPQFYDEDTITDQPERAIVAEIIREKALHALDDEIPSAHYRNSFQQMLRFITIHDNTSLCFQLPCTLVNVQNDRVHTQVHGGLLGA